MTSLFTKNFKVLMASQLDYLTDVNSQLQLPEILQSFLYVVIGKQLPWNTGTEVVPTPSETDISLNEYYKTGIYAKQVTYENSSVVIERIDWTNNTIYNTYEFSTNFYVKNSKDQVFKCLDNNGGIVSTSEPELTLSTTSLEEPYLKTSDGYKWKYMYTISSVQKQRFMDTNWMPVVSNKFVSAAAIPSSIDIVNVTNSGNNYTDGSLQNIITISGDGTGAIMKANVSGGQIQDIVIQERGTGYTNATLTFNDVTGGVGSGASATVKISPHDGHGYDPIFELGGSTIMFNVTFDGLEGGLFPTDNDFRQIVVVYNPKEKSTSKLATGTSYTLYSIIKTSPGLGDFNTDEKVYQGTTYADATFTADVISFDKIQNELYINNITGTLQTNQPVKGLQSGSIRIATNSQNPTFDLYSGKVIYISNKLPVSRDPDQTDKIRFILSF